MATDPAVFEGQYTLVIKMADGHIILHFRVDQDYTDEGLEMTLDEYGQGIGEAVWPQSTFEDCCCEETQDLEQFIQDGGDVQDLDVVNGQIVYP